MGCARAGRRGPDAERWSRELPLPMPDSGTRPGCKPEPDHCRKDRANFRSEAGANPGLAENAPGSPKYMQCLIEAAAPRNMVRRQFASTVPNSAANSRFGLLLFGKEAVGSGRLPWPLPAFPIFQAFCKFMEPPAKPRHAILPPPPQAACPIRMRGKPRRFAPEHGFDLREYAIPFILGVARQPVLDPGWDGVGSIWLHVGDHQSN